MKFSWVLHVSVEQHLNTDSEISLKKSASCLVAALHCGLLRLLLVAEHFSNGKEEICLPTCHTPKWTWLVELQKLEGNSLSNLLLIAFYKSNNTICVSD